MHLFQRPTDSTTRRRNARRSKRVARPSPGFNILPAAITMCVILMIGIMATPPRYIARASFVVDWHSLLSATDNDQAEKVRRECRQTVIAAVTSMPHSEREISEVLDRADGFRGSPKDKAILVARLQQRLNVTLAGQSDRGDLFTIEMRDSNPGAAQTSANWVLQGTVSKLKADVASEGEMAALRSQRKGEGGSLSNLGMMFFTDPVKVINEAQVETRGVGYGLCVLLVAVMSAGFAAIMPWLRHQFELVVTAVKVTAKSAARRAARLEGSPVRQRVHVPNRPILLRPLPQYCVRAELPGNAGLHGDLSRVTPIQATLQGS